MKQAVWERSPSCWLAAMWSYFQMSSNLIKLCGTWQNVHCLNQTLKTQSNTGGGFLKVKHDCKCQSYLKDGLGDKLQQTKDSQCCKCEKKFHLIARWYPLKKTNTSSYLFFCVWLVITHDAPFFPICSYTPSLISHFLDAASIVSANSCLSVDQKWLCLADSADKRLIACCPQRKRTCGGEKRVRRWRNREIIWITIIFGMCKTPKVFVCLHLTGNAHLL